MGEISNGWGCGRRLININIDIVIDIELDINNDSIIEVFDMCSPHSHFTHWMRHVAAVPKGFLRYYVMQLLGEKPMSGSEIMTEIENRTNSRWKPSPGSIYPLLAWLHEKGYSNEVPDQEPGIKRYTLTDDGKALLEKCIEKKKELRRRTGFFAPPFVGPRWFNHYPKETHELVNAGKKLVKTSWVLLDSLREEYSEDAANEATEALEQAAKKIEEITKRLTEKGEA